MKILRDFILKERKIFENRLRSRKESIIDKNISGSVRKILEEVKIKGNSAVSKYTNIFDRVKLRPSEFKVSEREYNEAYRNVSGEFLSALRLAKKNIVNFHKKQIRKPVIFNNNGLELSLASKPIENVGIYVPGGKYSYLSTLIMCAVPAKIAKVSRVMVCSPPMPGPDGSARISPYLLVAAREIRVDEFYKIGGVTAIGALAFGTETIKKVDKIVGPGNIYVTEAKRQVFGIVGIDGLAGPSEIMIVADKSANPEFVAYDLLAQAEHDKNALAVLITVSKELAGNVNKIAGLKSNVMIIVVNSLSRAAGIINDYGPEHLEIILKGGKNFTKKIKNAGSILIGEFSPASLTDYTAGVNHVLPTRGAAKFSSVLSVDDFIKKINMVKGSKTGLKKLSEATSLLAKLEGFNYHKSSVEIRL